MTSPTTSWNTLRRDGYGVAYAVTIEGIPYVFAERQALVYDGTTPTVASGYTFSGALAVMPGTSISSEADRKSGVGTGRALNLTLSRQRLVAEDIASVLFARPSLRALVTTDVTSPATTTITVGSTTGWASSGALWIGREYMTYSGTTATTFTGCTRGVVGYPHVVKSGLASGYSYATDTPMYWRGRLATVYEHLLMPCGQMMGTAWATVGTYCRQIWLGFVDQQPQPAASGFVLRCLPIERLCAAKIGADLTADIVTGDIYASGNYPAGGQDSGLYSPIVWAGETDQMYARSSADLSVAVGPTTEMGFCSLVGWGTQAIASFDSLVTNATGRAMYYYAGQGAPCLKGQIIADASTDMLTVSANAWFCEPGEQTFISGSTFTIPLRFNTCPAWLVVRPDADALEAAASLPSSGYGVVTSDGGTELVQWDTVETNAVLQLVGVRLVARGIGGTPRLDAWNNGGTLKLVVGTQGAFEVVVRRLLTSSGTGDRGANDTLAFGMGLGLPDEMIADFPAYPFAGAVIDTISSGTSSFEEMLGGWLSLWRRSLVQRLDADGYVRLFPCETTCTDETTAADVTITADDTTNAGTSALELQEAPNAIEIRRGTMGSDKKLIVRDAARVQAEGARQWSMRAPGISDVDAVTLSTDLLALSDGQAAFDVHLAPWVKVRMGELVVLSTAHPQAYDWDAGEWANGDLVGRVIGHERDLWTGAQKIVLLTAGQSAASLYLCPAAAVTSVTTQTPLTFRVAAGDGRRFAAGEVITLYTPGNEGAERIDRTIATVTETASYDEIACTTNGAGWEDATTVITFAGYASCSARQQAFMFQRADRDWV